MYCKVKLNSADISKTVANTTTCQETKKVLLLEIGFQLVFPALMSSLRRRHPAIFGGLSGGLLECGSVSRNFSNSIVFHSVVVLIPLSPSLSRQSYNVLYVADSSYFLVGYSVMYRVSRDTSERSHLCHSGYALGSAGVCRGFCGICDYWSYA